MPFSSPVYREAPFAIVTVLGPETAAHQLLWGHGWGQSSGALLPIADSLKPFASSTLIDFPGFGKTSKPTEVWGTADYADQVAAWMRLLPEQKWIWIGHSFGGRVGLQLAARHPDLLAGMVLIASAGLPRQKSFVQKIRTTVRTAVFKTAKRVLREGPQLERLRQRMGSMDYRMAGALRPIFTKVVGENLTEIAKAVRCPTLLIYGRKDTETPPEIGERLQGLISRSQLVLLDEFGHLNILTEGRHQVASRIRKFLESLP